MKTIKHAETQQQLNNEQTNIRASWNWLISKKRVDDISHYARSFHSLFIDHPFEGEALFRQALDILDDDNPQHHIALGYILIYKLRYQASTLAQMIPCLAKRLNVA